MRSKMYGDNYLKVGATELIIKVKPSGEMLVFCQPWVKLLRLYLDMVYTDKNWNIVVITK